jgi:hypothetical protein
LKPQYDEPLSNFAFKSSLRRYTLEPSAEELAQGREEVKHREMLKSTAADDGSRASRSIRAAAAANAHPAAGSEPAQPMLLRPFALRDYWLARGAYLIKRGAIAAATTLLQEAAVHARAHDDAEVEAWAYLQLAKCAAYGNKPIAAIKLQHKGQRCGGDVAFWVGWCRLTASTPVLKAPMLSSLEAAI